MLETTLPIYPDSSCHEREEEKIVACVLRVLPSQIFVCSLLTGLLLCLLDAIISMYHILFLANYSQVLLDISTGKQN